MHIPVVEQFVDRMAATMGGHEGALPFEVINRTASTHFTGGMPIDGSVMPDVRWNDAPVRSTASYWRSRQPPR